jgi:hypothetical protein
MTPPKISKRKAKTEKKEADMDDLKKELDIVNIDLFFNHKSILI